VTGEEEEMTQSIPYKIFVEYRFKLNQAMDDLAHDKKSAASNRLRGVKKHLDDLEAVRTELNCESVGRLNHLQKMAANVEASK